MTSHVRRPIAVAALVAVIAIAGALAIFVVYAPEIPAVPDANRTSFPLPLVERGAKLAAIGNCAVCHTAPNGQPFAGGRALPTPFGTLFGSNITPDPATGIGTWSQAAFRRAMKRGIARDGTHLYPALPYEHFTHVDDADLHAIYAFLMTRRAVAQTPPPNRLVFSLGFRPILAGWNLLFLHETPFTPSANQSEAWNRGAYLVEGLGHCGDCHTPRTIIGAEEQGKAFAGGKAEGWNAPSLDRSNPSPVPWTVDSLTTYLRAGVEPDHGAAGGPMGPVVHDLANAPLADVRAIATYVAWLMAKPPATATAPAPGPPAAQLPSSADRAADAAHREPAGASLFAGACSGCHEPGAPMVTMGGPPLEAVGDIRQDDPRNTIQALLHGIRPPSGRAGPAMPAFDNALTGPQLAGIAAYLRARFSDRPAWTDLGTAVATARKEGGEP